MVCLPSRSYGFESHCSQRSVYVFVTSASGVFFFIELSMPQMDKVAFFSQLFWLMVTFYGFYMTTYIPNLAYISEVRQKNSLILIFPWYKILITSVLYLKS